MRTLHFFGGRKATTEDTETARNGTPHDEVAGTLPVRRLCVRSSRREPLLPAPIRLAADGAQDGRLETASRVFPTPPSTSCGWSPPRAGDTPDGRLLRTRGDCGNRC